MGDAGLHESVVAVAGRGAVALVFDPGERVDGPDAVDSHTAVGVREVREP